MSIQYDKKLESISKISYRIGLKLIHFSRVNVCRFSLVGFFAQYSEVSFIENTKIVFDSFSMTIAKHEFFINDIFAR